MLSNEQKLKAMRSRMERELVPILLRNGYQFWKEESRVFGPKEVTYTFGFVNRKLKLKFSLLFSTDDGELKPGAALPSVDSFSLFLKKADPKNLYWPEPDPGELYHDSRMWISLYCKDMGLPLANVEENREPARELEDFLDRYFRELGKALTSYLAPFLEGQQFVQTRDIRDDYIGVK